MLPTKPAAHSKQSGSLRNQRQTLLTLAISSLCAVGGGSYGMPNAFASESTAGQKLAQSAPSSADVLKTNSSAEASKTETAAPGTKKVLPASKFFGAAQEGYLYAAKCPELLEKVFCYCGCDYADGHTSLLDCFSTDHGADCPICTDEAKTVFSLKLQGKNLHEIQLAIDKKFSALRDNSIPSTPQLVKYRTQMKLLKSAPTGKKTASTGSTPTNLNTATSDLPTTVPGRGKIGSCCGHHQN